MITTLSLFFVSLLTILMTVGCVQSSVSDLYWLPILLGIIWTVILLKRWSHYSGLLLVITFLMAMLLLINDGLLFWVIPGCFSAILAWDLEQFGTYLLSVDRIVGKKKIIIRHLSQLTILSGSAMALIWLVSQITLKLNLVAIFGLILLLALAFKKRH